MLVKAKRAGFTEKLTPEQAFDMEPLDEKEHDSLDLEGELVRQTVSTPFGEVEIVTVDGQEADPLTIVPLE